MSASVIGHLAAGVTVGDVQSAGVVGAGGAGFPTHAKLTAQVDTVIVNGAECEPLLHKDKEILRTRGELVVRGLAVAMALTGAQSGIVAVKEKYADVIDSLRAMLGGDMSLAQLHDVYPAGDELILIYDVLGRIVPPGKLPLDVGVISINVETALNVALGAQTPVVEKFITVGGAVAQPTTLRVPIGTAMSECVAAAGGATVDDPNYIVGGVMMGYLEPDHDAPVDKRTGGLIVLGSDHVLVRRRRRDFKQISRIARSACDQCNFCTELCPRYLLGHPIDPARAMRSLAFSTTGQSTVPGAAYCSECNLCALYACPEDLDPKSVCAQNKKQLAQQGAKWRDPPFVPIRAEMLLPGRKAPMRRVMRKLDLMGSNNDGPINEVPLKPNKVGIKLTQHIGARCVPTVTVGQQVATGDLVGWIPKGDPRAALGAPVHASIDGRITEIEDEIVWIERL